MESRRPASGDTRPVSTGLKPNLSEPQEDLTPAGDAQTDARTPPPLPPEVAKREPKPRLPTAMKSKAPAQSLFIPKKKVNTQSVSFM